MNHQNHLLIFASNKCVNPAQNSLAVSHIEAAKRCVHDDRRIRHSGAVQACNQREREKLLSPEEGAV